MRRRGRSRRALQSQRTLSARRTSVSSRRSALWNGGVYRSPRGAFTRPRRICPRGWQTTLQPTFIAVEQPVAFSHSRTHSARVKLCAIRFLLLFPCAGYLPGSPTAFDCEDLAARPPVFRDLMSIGTETIDSIEAQEACVSDCFYGSPGRNRNQIEKTGNLCDFRFWFGTDTPKNTPSKRWLLPDAVG